MPIFSAPLDGTEVSPESADLSAIDPAWHERALGYMFPPSVDWPNGYVRQSDLDFMARIHPVGYGMGELEALTNRRSDLKDQYDKANAAWLAELRKVYRAGRPARVLAEVTNLSSARISQLVGGSRR